MFSIFGDRFKSMITEAPQVLILTRSFDKQSDEVGLKLAARGIPYIRFDADLLYESSSKVSVWEDEERTGYSCALGSHGQELNHPRVIWFRHFDPTAIPTFSDDPTARMFVRSEWEMGLRGLLSLRGTRWINHPDSVSRLDRITQLRIARSVDLGTPKTLISNDHTQIRNFVGSCSNKVVAKVLGSHFLEVDPGTAHGVFPRIVEQDDDELENAIFAPAIYQEFVPHETEIRATVVGREIIAVEVQQQGPGDVWENPEGVEVKEHSLPDAIQSQLQAYMDFADLEYGAFDLLLTWDGRYVFLEVNPSGDWLWLEARNDSIDLTSKVSDHIANFVSEEAFHG
jgi:hypothetical protein